MEEYINYGLSVLAEKLKEDEGFFYNKNSFLDIFKFKGLTRPKQDTAEEEEDAPVVGLVSFKMPLLQCRRSQVWARHDGKGQGHCRFVGMSASES